MMPNARALLPLMLATTLLAGCGQASPAQRPTVAPQQAAKASYFDRFEAQVTHDARGIAILELTAKGLVTQFTDEELTVIEGEPGDEANQRVLFNSPLMLGQDGALYLQETVSGQPAPRFYRVGTYAYARSRTAPRFTLEEGLKLEARNRSVLPIHGAGPYIAIVAASLPMPVSKQPALVRR